MNKPLSITLFLLLTQSLVFASDFAFTLATSGTRADLVLDNYTITLQANSSGLLDGSYNVYLGTIKGPKILYLQYLNGKWMQGESFYANGKTRTKFNSPIPIGREIDGRDPFFTLLSSYYPWGKREYWSEDGQVGLIRIINNNGDRIDSMFINGKKMLASESLFGIKDTSLANLIMTDEHYNAIMSEIESRRILPPLEGFAFDPNKYIRARIDMDLDKLKLNKDYKNFVSLIKRHFKKRKEIDLSVFISSGKLESVESNFGMEEEDFRIIKSIFSDPATTAQIRIYDIPFDGLIYLTIHDPKTDGC